MKVCLFLHCHQPPTQFPEVLQAISAEAYQKILSLLGAYPQAKLTFNLTNSFLEQVDAEIIERFKGLVRRGQVELTVTAAYHPLLPFLPEAEIERQILLSQRALQRCFGLSSLGNRHSAMGPRQKELLPNDLAPIVLPRLRGFFPPEMAVDESVLVVIRKLGLEWVATEETGVDDPDLNHVVFVHGSGVKIVRRHRQLSLAVAFAQIRRLEDLLRAAGGRKQEVVILAMDAETFGHHRPEQLVFLEELLAGQKTNNYQLVTISELVDKTEAIGPVLVKTSTWGGSFDRWRNPKNPVHQLQWQLTNLAIEAVQKSKIKSQKSEEAQNLLDKALHSDQYWWAAHDPCWHLPMVERGAKLLLGAVEALPGAKKEKLEARRLYKEICETGIRVFGEAIIGC